MLATRKIPKTCLSCRLHLLSLFENGFISSTTRDIPRTRQHSTARANRRYAIPAAKPHARKFSRSRSYFQEPSTNLPNEVDTTLADLESFVRQARQTFGETLPKDYLSQEEYLLYERLYGPPLRETRFEDLEFVPVDELELSSEKARNVVLRENKEGEFEEIEFDPALGFSYVDENSEPYIDEDKVVEEDVTDPVSLEFSQELDDIEGGEDLSSSIVQLSQDHSQEGRKEYNVIGQNQREIDAISRLRADMEADALLNPAKEEEDEDIVEVENEEEYVEDEAEEEFAPDERWETSDEKLTHPHTLAGRYGTTPSTVWLPEKAMIEPITELLERTHTKHVMDAAEKAFGGKGFPYSTSVPGSKKMLPQMPIGLSAAQHRMSEIEADAYIAAILPGTYATIMNIIVEVRKRLGRDWIRDILLKDGGVHGPRILDCAGGAGLLAVRELVRIEWDLLKSEGLVRAEDPPHCPGTVLTGSNTLRHRVSRFLDDTTFLPRLPDYFHARSERDLDGGAKGSSEERKVYDIILSPHMLFPLKEDFRRRNLVKNLWTLLDPYGGVLILAEKGLPRGFEAIAEARAYLLDSHIMPLSEDPIGKLSGMQSTTEDVEAPMSRRDLVKQKEEGMIIAPCTNHNACPMYPEPGLSWGRKDYCYFSQRFIRPPFLQKVLGAKIRNHEDVKFSYVAVRRGIDLRRTDIGILQSEEGSSQAAEGYEEHDLPESEMEEDIEVSDVRFHPLSLPRIMLQPLKRKGHVTMDVCSPAGTLERWTIPKSFSRTAYRDARKSNWGDLWALGAKTIRPRNVRLGKVGGEPKMRSGKLKGVRQGKMSDTGKKVRKELIEMTITEDGDESVGRRKKRHDESWRNERRTKGGRVLREPKPIREKDMD